MNFLFNALQFDTENALINEGQDDEDMVIFSVQELLAVRRAMAERYVLHRRLRLDGEFVLESYGLHTHKSFLAISTMYPPKSRFYHNVPPTYHTIPPGVRYGSWGVRCGKSVGFGGTLW